MNKRVVVRAIIAFLACAWIVAVPLLWIYRSNTTTTILPCENGIVMGYIAASQAAIFDTENGYQGVFGPYEKVYVVVRGESGQERMYEVKWTGARTAPSGVDTAWLCVTEATNPMRKGFY